jgi:hypothetical protein
MFEEKYILMICLTQVIEPNLPVTELLLSNLQQKSVTEI